jgi:hypothetical protein
VGGIVEALFCETEHVQCANASWAPAPVLWQCIVMAPIFIRQRPFASQQERTPVNDGASPPGTIAASNVSNADHATTFRIFGVSTTDRQRSSSPRVYGSSVLMLWV